MSLKKVAIFASGSGSNAQSIIEYFNKKEGVDVSFIISNKSDAFVVKRAKKLGVKCFVFNIESFKNNLGVLEILTKHKVDWIVLAGFLLKVPEYIIEKYENRILNIHPALLPKYGGKGMYGIHVHRSVLQNKETASGISIHLVNKNYDEGKIIFQAKCKVFKQDTVELLSKRIHQLEHLHYPKVIEQTISTSN